MRVEPFELPENLKEKLTKAKKMEWITILYLVTVVILMYLVMGSSQAMKTAWLEDALSMVPAISFLIASRIYNKKPTQKFQYGFHRVFSIAFLTGSIALFGMGLFLLVDSAITLIKAEHPTIGTIVLFGHQIWMGWIMIAALVYSSLPAMYLGYKKLPLAKKLHNKILFTDANAQKADYMTGFAAMAGILGIGMGWWWADASAALFISFSVLKDGYTNLKDAVEDLMDRKPLHIKDDEPDELVDKVENFIKSWDWVEDAKVRFREEGQVYFGDVQLIVKPGTNVSKAIEEGLEKLYEFHWKIYDVTLMPVEQIKDYSEKDS
ncbi:cation diffusion facilitator family transporter [Aequorivita todarodis]|uniref:cation diffusion facilitator family transporter n=1 Tax=Aequorivita todarodis TaxID=2036821 RepID=UPI002350C2C1|nr:cation diffusion facilitator family transporter [Aequorivita todarodis]MDC8001979.1 cation diffusion facilitator family transporter [Aequorivita todarodis]